jgi:hypothetical protein
VSNIRTDLARFGMMILIDTIFWLGLLTYFESPLVETSSNCIPSLLGDARVARLQSDIFSEALEAPIFLVCLDQHFVTGDGNEVEHLSRIWVILSTAFVNVKLGRVARQ